MSDRALKVSSLVGLIVAYAVTRLVNLLSFPIFVDEAIHIERAVKGIIGEVFDRGKLLPVPALMPFVSLPVDDLLIARLIVVIAGLLTLLAIVWTGTQLFSFKVGWWSGLIYVLLPFALFYNRLDMADDFDLLFAAMALAYAVKIAREPGNRFDTFMLTLALVGGVLSKLTGFVFFSVPPLVIVALNFPDTASMRKPMRSIFPALLIAGVMTIMLILFGYGDVELKSKSVDTLSDIPANIQMTLEWYWGLLTPIGCALLVASAIRRDRRVLLLLLIFLMVPTVYILGGSPIYSRYVLTSIVPLSILIGALLARLLNGRQRAARTLAAVAVLGIAFMPFDLTLLMRPLDTPLPGYDQTQYIDNAPVGIREMMDYLRSTFNQESGQKQVVILGGRPNLHIVWYALREWPDTQLDRVDITEADDLVSKTNIWLIVDGKYYPDAHPPGKTRVWSYTGSDTTRGLELWH